MNALDLTILAVLAIFTLLGIYWGLIRQVLALTGLVVGIALAGRYGPVVSDWLTSFTTNDALAGVIGFVVVLIGVSAAASLVASLLRMFVGLLFLGWLDNLLGSALGLIQGVLASATLLIVAVTFPMPLWQGALETSRLAGALLRIGTVATLLLPTTFQQAVQAALR